MDSSSVRVGILSRVEKSTAVVTKFGATLCSMAIIAAKTAEGIAACRIPVLHVDRMRRNNPLTRITPTEMLGYKHPARINQHMLRT